MISPEPRVVPFTSPGSSLLSNLSERVKELPERESAVCYGDIMATAAGPANLDGLGLHALPASGASIYDVRTGGGGVPKKQTKGTKSADL